jgi:hypothetical protein
MSEHAVTFAGSSHLADGHRMQRPASARHNSETKANNKQ